MKAILDTYHQIFIASSRIQMYNYCEPNSLEFIGGVKWLKRLINQEKRRKTQVSIQLLVHAVVIPARNEL